MWFCGACVVHHSIPQVAGMGNYALEICKFGGLAYKAPGASAL